MKFQVIKGTHREKGIRYCTGDVVESHRDLSEVFKNKFIKLQASRRTKGGNTKEPSLKKQTGFRTIDRGSGRYDVVNEKSGEVINEQFLSLEDAKEMERATAVPFSKIPAPIQAELSEEVKVRKNLQKK